MTTESWNRYHCYAMALSSLLFLFTNSLYAFIAISFVSFIILWKINWNYIRHIFGGLANWVTSVRYFGLIVLCFIFPGLSDFQITSWLLILVFLDWLDGYLARKFSHQTKMGAYFDMETDSLFVCLVSCTLYARGLSPPFIFIPAFMRYFYTVILHISGLYKIEEERTHFGPTVAVIMFLILSISFVLKSEPRFYLLSTGSILITTSFAYSFFLIIKKYKKAQFNN